MDFNMIIVTGGAGFIGSNLIASLNKRSRRDIIVVDSFLNGRKCMNLSDLDFIDMIDFKDFLKGKNKTAKVDAIFHLGACSDTSEWDGSYLLDKNYNYSKSLLHFALDNHIPFIYASSAAVYGDNIIFKEERTYEKPLNLYAFTKFQFDQYVRSLTFSASQIVGLRYFNVYGPREAHKGKMASLAFQFFHQLLEKRSITLFGEYNGYSPGEQLRDFIHVDDCVLVNLWFLDNPSISGIFNVGTGKAYSFNQMAMSIINGFGYGEIQYTPFPEAYKSKYQCFTQADISLLRSKGYNKNFTSLHDGIKQYLSIFLENHPYSNPNVHGTPSEEINVLKKRLILNHFTEQQDCFSN